MKKILVAFFLLFSFFFIANLANVAASSTFDVQVRTYLDDANKNIAAPTMLEQQRGQKISFNASGISSEYTFAFYVVNGIIAENLPQNFMFTVRSNMSITAIYYPNGSVTPSLARHVVVFSDSNGSLLDVQYIEDGENASDTSIDLPLVKPNSVISENKWATKDGLTTSINNIVSNKVFYLQYEYENSLTFNLTVTDSDGSGEYDFNEVVILNANSFKESVPFSHWEDGSGNILSYSQTYALTMLSDRTVVAIYSASRTVVPVISMTNDLNLRSSYDSYMGQFQLPAGYSLVEYGFVFSRSSDILTLNSLGATIVPSNVHQGQTKEFLRSFPNDTFNSIRAYLIVLNQSLEEEIYYSDNYYRDPASIGEPSNILYNPTTTNNGYAPKNVILNELEFRLNGTQIANTSGKGVTGSYFVMNPSNINGDPRYKAHIEFNALSATQISFLIAPWTTTEAGQLTKFSFQVYSDDSWLDLLDLLPLVPDTVAITYLVQISLTGGVYRIYSESEVTSDTRVIVDEITIQSGAFSGPIHEVVYDVEGVLTTEMLAQGDTVSFIPTKANYTFNGWFLDEDLNTSYENNPIAMSYFLYAKFSPEIKTVTFNYNGANGGEMPATIQAPYDSFIDLPVPTKTGYVFDGWYNESLETPYSDPYQIPSVNRNMYAKWIINDLGRTIEDSAEITLPSQISVAQTLDLPDLGSNGSSIAWSSSHESIINSTSGNVTLPVEDTTVTLTATVTYNDEETIRYIQINVIAEDSEPIEPVVLRQSDFGETNSNFSTYANFYIDNVENGSLDSSPAGTSPYSRAGGNYNGTSWDYLAFGQNSVAARLGDMVTSNSISNVAVDATDPNNYVATRFTLNGVNKIEIRLFLLKLQTTIYLQSSIDGINWISVSLHEQTTAISSDTTITFESLSGSGDLYYRIVFVNASPGSNGWLGRLKSLTFYGNP